MLLEINIEKDLELRNYVKKLIKSQVKSVLREEIKPILKELIEKKWFPNGEASKDIIITEVLKKILLELLRSHCEFKYKSDNQMAYAMAKEASLKYIQELFTDIPQLQKLIEVMK